LPGLLLFLQPDIGGIIIIFSLWFGILLVSGIKLRHIFFIIVIGIIFSMVAWFYLLHDYQKQRVISFLFVQDPQGASWSQNQAKIAIGSGGFWGKGFAKGSQTQLKFLPEPQTDFIFSAIAEEFGFIGVFSLLLLYCILLWRLIIIAINSKSNFPRLFAVGVAILLGSKMIINVGMNLGLLPVIGIPIPLVSYGGSNMIATMISLGIVQSTKLS
jgi:rod shape determining protein RodA